VKTISKPLTASQIGYVEPPNHKHKIAKPGTPHLVKRYFNMF
jgi:hypothetical protein